MGKRFQSIVIVVALIVIIGGLFVVFRRRETTPDSGESGGPTATSTRISKGDAVEIIVTIPAVNEVISSPVTFSGKAKGSWFFEGSFPITLLDEDGSILGNSAAHAQGSWQTEGYVNFTGTVQFKEPKGKTGKLVFANDNPSGLPQNEKTLSVPVQFKK